MDQRRSGHAGRSRPRLLLVDDDPAVLFGFAEYFRSRGMLVDTAAELERAEALLAQRKYDVVISDLRLLGGSAVQGLEVLAAARRAGPRTGTVLISAYLTEETEQEAKSQGIDVVVRKPLAAATLERILLRLLEGER